jgi:NADPH:quinone reductase-like Zn-dependent oxidoreductase
MLVHEQQLFRISPEMNDEQAVLLEPTAVALHAVLRRLPRPGDNVLIIGAGTIGLLTLQVIHALVPDAIVSVMARYPFQIEQATRMGASHIIYPHDSYQEVEGITGAKLFTGGFNNKMLLGGFEVIFDAIGTRKTLHDSLRWVRAGGATVLIGVSLHTMQLDLTPIWYQEIDLIGALAHGVETWPIGSFERRSTFSIAAEMIENELLYPEKLITHHFALTNYRSAFATATSKSQSRSIKVVFDYSLLPSTVVPNVRASARQRHPITTDAVWPQEQLSTHDETNLAMPVEEHSVQAEYQSTQEPTETTDSMSQSPVVEIVEIEETHQFLFEEQPEQAHAFRLEEQSEQVSEISTEEETEHVPIISNTGQSTIEEKKQTTSQVNAKPRRSRNSTKSQKQTEDIQTSTEDIENTTATNTAAETPEE